jgi:S-adenosylmethionine hydrolase
LSQQVITLLSDLGTRDASVTIAKAMLMRHAPGAVIVDVSHNVIQYDLQQAAFLLLSAYKHFPAGTVHIIMVDVFAGDTPGMLLAEKDGFYFIAPDNGVLPLAFGAELQDSRLCYVPGKPFVFNDWLSNAGLVIDALREGNAQTLFPTHTVKDAPGILQPIVTRESIDCKVLYIDRYENVILNITRQQFDELVDGRPFRVMLRMLGNVTTISNNYNDVPQGKALCRFNESGFLEIALNHAGAATLLGLNPNNASTLRHQTIRIFF